MFCVTLTIHPDEEDGAVTLLHGTPLTGIDQENRDDGLLDLRAWYLSEAGALQAQAQLPHAHIHHQPDDNWNATWQSQWQPMEVGQRWYLTPPGDTSVTPAHRIRLALRPGLAFGNGDHPTTHLCLQALEIELRAGDRFLDVGCGSGLLGEAAQLLGAQAFGCDLNPTNLPPNAFLGSLDAVKEQSMDVAVMNIQAGTLVRLWPRLTRVVRRTAILSGYLSEQSALVEDAIEAPWRITERQHQAGWCSLTAQVDGACEHPADH